MKVWIDRCIQREGRLSWERVSTLVRESHRNGDTNLMQHEINLAHGLKDKQASMLFIQYNFIMLFHKLLMLVSMFFSHPYITSYVKYVLCVWHIVVETSQGYVVQWS
jgi:hypothetical protein